MAPVIRVLGGLEGEVKMRECVGTMLVLRVLRALGKSPPGPAPLLGIRASRALWVSDSVMWGFAMCISVRGWKVGVDPFSVR